MDQNDEPGLKPGRGVRAVFSSPKLLIQQLADRGCGSAGQVVAYALQPVQRQARYAPLEPPGGPGRQHLVLGSPDEVPVGRMLSGEGPDGPQGKAQMPVGEGGLLQVLTMGGGRKMLAQKIEVRAAQEVVAVELPGPAQDPFRMGQGPAQQGLPGHTALG